MGLNLDRNKTKEGKRLDPVLFRSICITSFFPSSSFPLFLLSLSLDEGQVGKGAKVCFSTRVMAVSPVRLASDSLAPRIIYF